MKLFSKQYMKLFSNNNDADALFWESIRAYRQYKTPFSPEVIEWAKNWPDKILGIGITTCTRFVECESDIIDSLKKDDSSIDFNSICSYCNSALRGRWIELEEFLLNNPRTGNHPGRLVSYASQVIKGRWKEAEDFINEPRQVLDYAKNVLHKRWNEKEEILLKDPRLIFEYCYGVMNRERWKEGEDALLRCNYHDKINLICFYQNHVVKVRWPEAELVAKEYAEFAFHYAANVIRGRWEEGEAVIAKDPIYALKYAQDVLKGAFPLAEKTLLSSPYYFDYFTFSTSATRDLVEKLANQFDPNMTIADVLKKVKDGRNKDFETKLLNSSHNQRKAVWYAANILKDRWVEAEDTIKRSAKWSVAYAKDVIKGRWEDGEKTIAKDPKYLADYGVNVIKDQLPIFLHNILITEKLKGSEDKQINKYFEMLEKNS